MTIDKSAVKAANPLERVVLELLNESPKRVGRELMVRCPWHEDKKPSLRIDPIKELWYCDPCGIGGDVFEFVQRHQHLTFPEAKVWLAHRAGLSNNGNGHSRTAVTHTSPRADAPRPASWPQAHALRFFDYPQPDGVVVRKVRYDESVAHAKMLWLHSRDGGHTWFYGAGCDDPGLYGFEAAIALAQRTQLTAILIAEGERDAQRLLDLGLPAVSPPHGASLTMGEKQWNPAYSEQVQAAGFTRAYLFGDHDPPGDCFSRDIARALTAIGLDARPVPWDATEPEKFDVTDFLDRHGDVDGKRLIIERLTAVKHGEPWRDPTASEELTEDVDEDLDITPLVEATWPAPLSRAAYVGIFGDIVDALAPQTEADPAALLLQLLALFGNVIGRTAHFCVEADTHYLNLFEVLVGKTSKGRKGVSEGQSRRFFGAIDEAWAMTCHASGLSSGEGLIAAIRDAVVKQQPIREKKQIIGYEEVIEDHGVTDKRLYVNESEFASTLKVMMREGNTLSPVLRNAWDGRTLRTLTKASPLRATGPHVTIIGSITQHEVRRCLNVTEYANGFANRFLWACVQRSQYLPDGGAPVHVDALIDRLRALVIQARDVGEMRRDPEAGALWHRVYHDLSTGRPGLFGALTARAEAQVMRLACLYALGDGSPRVRAIHLTAALEVWRYCFESAAYIFGDSLGDRQADTLLAALKAAGPAGLTRRELTIDVFQRNLSAAELRRVLAMLHEAALVSRRHEPSQGGRRAERWVYALRTYELNEQSPAAGADGGTLFVKFVAPALAGPPSAPPAEVERETEVGEL